MKDPYTEKNHLEKWADKHLRDILIEIKVAGIELTRENIPIIIEETSFRVRSQKYPGKCPYYNDDPINKRKKGPCHIEVIDLNCFLCACPEYKNDRQEGGCNLQCILGKWYENPNLPLKKIWDCSNCGVPHFPNFVKDYLERNMDRLREIH